MSPKLIYWCVIDVSPKCRLVLVVVNTLFFPQKRTIEKLKDKLDRETEKFNKERLDRETEVSLANYINYPLCSNKD